APYHYEAAAWRAGLARISGICEGRRGPLARPGGGAAGLIAPDRRGQKLCRSQPLPPQRPGAAFPLVTAPALAVGVGIRDHATIDRVNILQATRLAMLEALGGLGLAPDLVITDFVKLPGLACPQRNLVDGDQRCASVAAASIIAKVTRDRLMVE